MARTTDKRERILEYITQFTRENGYSPSVREICEGVGLASTATVHYHLNALRQEGSINMDGKKNRTISLPDRLQYYLRLGRAEGNRTRQSGRGAACADEPAVQLSGLPRL